MSWASFAKRLREAFRARYLLLFGTTAMGGYLCADVQSMVPNEDGKTIVLAGFILIVGCMAASIRHIFP